MPEMSTNFTIGWVAIGARVWRRCHASDKEETRRVAVGCPGRGQCRSCTEFIWDSLLARCGSRASPRPAPRRATQTSSPRGRRSNAAIARASTRWRRRSPTHVLQPYVAYWQLKLRIDSAADDEVKAFLARWAQTPFADRLRVDWLKSLGKRGQWATFGSEYSPQPGEDVELACYAIQYRRQSEGDAALKAARPLWFTDKATPDACDPLFAALIAKNVITVEDRRARYRLAVEAGNVRVAQAIAVDLPPADRISAQEFAHVERNPSLALAKGDFRWKQQGGRDLALYALERAARVDAAGARAAWVRQRSRLPVADRLYGNARIAYHASRQFNPLALEWYREADGAALSDAQRAWRIRAALRAGAWPDVLATIDAMPPTEAQETAWRYWKARALTASRTGPGSDCDLRRRSPTISGSTGCSRRKRWASSSR